LLDADLGYPCYVPDTEEMMEKTVLNLGRGVRAYVNLVATACELLYPPPPDKELKTDTMK
jgi:hypothetical protein